MTVALVCLCIFALGAAAVLGLVLWAVVNAPPRFPW